MRRLANPAQSLLDMLAESDSVIAENLAFAALERTDIYPPALAALLGETASHAIATPQRTRSGAHAEPKSQPSHRTLAEYDLRAAKQAKDGDTRRLAATSPLSELDRTSKLKTVKTHGDHGHNPAPKGTTSTYAKRAVTGLKDVATMRQRQRAAPKNVSVLNPKLPAETAAVDYSRAARPKTPDGALGPSGPKSAHPLEHLAKRQTPTKQSLDRPDNHHTETASNGAVPTDVMRSKDPTAELGRPHGSPSVMERDMPEPRTGATLQHDRPVPAERSAPTLTNLPDPQRTNDARDASPNERLLAEDSPSLADLAWRNGVEPQ